MVPDYDMRDHYFIVAERAGEAYATARAAYVPDSDPAYALRLAASVVTRVSTHDELVEVLRRYGVPPYHQVSTFTLVSRLADAGLLAMAEAALEQDVSQKWRFSQATYIDADNEEVIALLSAIGADVAAMLAPET